MLKLYSLMSGSSGNCSIVTNGKTAVLSDCGSSGKRTLAALEKTGIPVSQIRAIVVSHEHADHTKGVGILARKLKIPVYATAGTHSAMSGAIGKLDDSLIRLIRPDITYDIYGIGVTPFAIPHDAYDPCGYSFSDGRDTVTVATDIGHMSDSLLSRLIGSRSIILESNHDIDMLRYGEYPYPLKRRILGDYGHLSNECAADTALSLIQNGTEHIMLGHLSEKNNLPEIALMETYNRLTDNGINVGTDATLQVANRYEPTLFNE